MTEEEQAKLSPMMQHYMEKKEEYKDCILFYRLGDFYEMFFEDALTASRELEITLTGRACGLEERAPMCGVPFHAAEMYIAKLISKGFKVAICEQLEDPKSAKGIVKRDLRCQRGWKSGQTIPSFLNRYTTFTTGAIGKPALTGRGLIPGF